MKTPNWLPEKITTLNGIDYYLAFEQEHIDAHHHFVTECEWTKADYAEIKDFYWFSAKVYAMKGQYLLAESYLGGCCYKNKKDVLSGDNWQDKLGGYMGQLVEECQEEAELQLGTMIKELTA